MCDDLRFDFACKDLRLDIRLIRDLDASLLINRKKNIKCNWMELHISAGDRILHNADERTTEVFVSEQCKFE